MLIEENIESNFEHGLQDNKYCFMKKCQLYRIKR